MRVLVAGSLNYEGAEVHTDAFVQACREVGAALARARCEFIVGSDSPATADRYILEGAAHVEGTHRVWIFRPDDGPTPKLPIESQRDRFSVSYRRLRGPWAAGRVPQVQAADCVLLVGGQRGTAQVGYAALALEKPVLAIGGFGGAAAELWSEFEPFYERLGAVSHQVGNLREEWQTQNAELAVRVLKELIRRRVFRRAAGVSMLGPLLLNVLFFIVWVWLFVAPPSYLPVQASFFALLGVSAFLGTALRGALRSIASEAEHRSMYMVVAEFRAGMVLAFALSLLYLAGSFSFTGKPMALDDTSTLADYQRIAIVMGLIGVLGGWLLEQVADSLIRWFGKRLPGSGPQ